MSLTRHRVVVQLKDVTLEDDSGPYFYVFDGFGMASPIGSEHAQRSITTTDVEICDNRTLQLSKVNSFATNARPRGLRQLQYDCVGAPSDIQTRAEFNSLLDLLLMNHYNCCLIQFTVQRECQIDFLSNLLVSEIDRRLQKSHAVLHGIRVELHDMRKFEVVNLFSKSTHVMRQRPRNHFNNTLELLKWLHSDYPHMWATGRGHSILDVHFHYSDGRRRMHRTKFCIVQIHTVQMDTDTKSTLKKFFENHTGEKRLKQTNTIIDCLREYFSGPELWRTWMLFEVPTSNSIGSTTEDLLNIANAAYAGSLTSSARSNVGVDENALNDDSDISTNFTAVESNSKPLIKLMSGTASLMLTKTQSASGSSTNAVTQKSKSHTGVIGNNTRGMTVLSSAIKESNQSKLKSKHIEDFSNKDLDSLSNWYTKVDEKFAIVIAALEAYYERKYELKIGKIGDEIQQIVRTGNMTDIPSEKPSCVVITKKSYSPDTLKELYDKYYDSLSYFRHLGKEVENSQFNDLLQVYLKTKNYELTQHVLCYKMRQLENCRSQLTDIIKKEMNALRTLKMKTISVQSIPRPRHVNIKLTTP